jgi:hypothetical protein
MKQSGSRISPFFTFPAERLRVFVGSPQPEVSGLPSRAQNFPSFVDVYGAVPYLYFSTGKSDNTYTSAIAAPNPLYASNPAPYNAPFIRVDPYTVSSTRFANATSFQIISAGKDQLFGQGNIRWAGAVGGAATQQSADDVANFHPTFLGVPNQ